MDYLNIKSMKLYIESVLKDVNGLKRCKRLNCEIKKKGNFLICNVIYKIFFDLNLLFALLNLIFNLLKFTKNDYE